VVGENWLAALQAAFADPAVDCVTGRVLPESLETPAQRHFETRFSFDRGPRPDRFTREDQRPWFPIHPYHLGTGCNMAFHRRVFDHIGLFDEALDAGMPTGGGGDLDIFRRLLLAGFTAVYDPKLLVYHEHRPTAAAARQQFLAYGKTFTALMSKIWFEEPTLKWQVPRLCRQQAVLLLRHFWQRLTNHRASVPLGLTILEAAGNFLGPWAYLQARHRAKTGQLQNWPAAEVTTIVCDDTRFTDLPTPDQKDLLLVFKAGPKPVAAKYLSAPGEFVSPQRLQKLAEQFQPAAPLAAPLEDSGQTPSVAVIICTRHRPQALRGCLSSLVAIRPFLTQLIVVDNSTSPAETAALAAEFGAQFLHEPRPGLCRARNRGLAAAQAEVVAYLDDDVIVDANWLAGLTAVYAHNKEAAGVMGLV
jgi:GT2 family glycosyltransferase